MLSMQLDWLNLGIAIIPIYWRLKTPIIEWSEYQRRLPTQNELRKWFDHKRRNVGVVCGWNDLVVLDFDSMDVFNLWLEWSKGNELSTLVAQYTMQVITARGRHLYVKIAGCKSLNLALYTEHPDVKVARYNPNVHNKSQLINVQSSGKYVLVPPSVHPTGFEYKFVDPNAPIVQVDSLQDIMPPMDLSQHYTEQTNVEPLDVWDAINNAPLEFGTIAKIRQEHNILDYLPNAEKSGGRWYKCLCPFHQDDKPSMWIDVKKQICGCYVCGDKPMDVINLVAKLNNIDNRQAIERLSKE